MAITLDGSLGISTPGMTNTGNESVSGTTTLSTGVLNIGSGQIYKDASGNVGIGTSSPSSGIQLGSPTANAVGASNTLRVFRGGVAGQYAEIDDLGAEFRLNSVNGAGGGIGFFGDGSRKMTLDSSGNLLVGTTSLASGFSTYAQIQASGTTGGIIINSATNNIGRVIFVNNNTSGNEGLIRYDGSNSSMQFFTAALERMRIDSSGNLLVGTTSANGKTSVFNSSSDANQPCIYVQNNKNFVGIQGINISSGNIFNDTGHEFFSCNDLAGGGATRMTVRSNGGIANYSANNVNLSDERVKTSITPAPSWLAKINAIEVVNFKYKDQTFDEPNLGVIAQQVLSVAPELVDEEGFGKTPEDGIPLMAIYETDLKYAMLKAIQELTARLEALEAK